LRSIRRLSNVQGVIGVQLVDEVVPLVPRFSIEEDHHDD
jgi:hypothetical protein